MITKEEFERFANSVNDMNLKRIRDKNETDKRIAKLEREVAYLMQFAPMEGDKY